MKEVYASLREVEQVLLIYLWPKFHKVARTTRPAELIEEFRKMIYLYSEYKDEHTAD